MELPVSTPSQWFQDLGVPSRVFAGSNDEVELYEEEGEFVLTMEMPGFEKDEIGVNFYENRLNVSAEHVDENRNRKRTYHRTFRLPKEVVEEDVSASYRNGILEIRLPIIEETEAKGRTIEVE